MKLATGIQDIGLLVRQGHWTAALSAVRRRLYSDSVAVGFARDLSRQFTAPAARVPISIRPLEHDEGDVFIPPRGARLAGEEVHELRIRLHMLEARIGTCYAAVDGDGKVCYVQWLIMPAYNDLVEEFFNNRFPRLHADERLLEGAYTFPAHRGRGIMACAMARIADKAAGLGARQVITFVGEDNIASLKGCMRAGFQPYLLRKERCRLLHQSCEYERLPGDRMHALSFSSRRERGKVGGGR